MALNALNKGRKMSLSNHLKKLFIVTIIFGVNTVFADETEDLMPLINKHLPAISKVAEDPIVIAAIAAQNAEAISLDEIKKRDAQWMATTGVNDTMKAMMQSPAAKALEKFESSQAFYFESFAMDNQGANVAMTNKTSDYWQGDEEKFTESFKGGAGEVYVAKPKFDESAQAYLVQISIPVKAEGKTIGVITVGVNLDELEAVQ